MKNIFRAFGIIALIVVIGFGMISCDNGTTDNGTGGGDPGDGSSPYYGTTWEADDGTTLSFTSYTEWQMVRSSGTAYKGTYTYTASSITCTPAFMRSNSGATWTAIPPGYATPYTGNVSGDTITVDGLGQFVSTDGGGTPGGDDDPGGDGDPKTLSITGITPALAEQGIHGYSIGVFRAGTSEANVWADYKAYQMGLNTSNSNMVAGIDDETSVPGGALVAPLVNLSTREPWTGSGTFDVYLILYDGDIMNVYKKADVEFETASTDVAISEFGLFANRTYVIYFTLNGISAEQAAQGANGAMFGVFPAGTPEENVLADFMAYYSETGIPNYMIGYGTEPGIDISEDAPPYYLFLGVIKAADKDSSWTDTGTYDLYLILNDENDVPHVYKGAGVLEFDPDREPGNENFFMSISMSDLEEYTEFPY